MIPVNAPKGDFRFRIIGGGLQLRLNSVQDLANILLLDEALWAVTSVDIDAMRFDKRFLEFVDSDHDGKIRSDEVKKAVKFSLDYFSDLSALSQGKAELSPDAINPDAQGAPEAIACAKLILKNLKRDPGSGVTVKDILDARSITSFTQRNGDGVISCENGLPPEIAELINAIIASGRKSLDRSGSDGVDFKNVEEFQAALTRKNALWEEAKTNRSIMVYGKETAAVFALFSECEPLIDSYFLNSDAGIFLAADPQRPVKKEASADLMVTENVRTVLENAVVAIPDSEGVLDFSSPLNPLHADKLLELANSCALKKYLSGKVLKKADYIQAKNAFAPFAKWKSEMEVADGLEKFTEDELRKLKNAPFDELKALIASDLSFAPVISAGETLLKMAYFQEFLMEFLNNFVSLTDLFNTERFSRLQMGKLVMDGRHFTLVVRVTNPAEHKRIIKSSNICVIYVEITRTGEDKKAVKELLAAAVTSGTMRSLFIGKHGVFFDSGGVIYDAVIKDIVEQPVSIGEAFKAPFFQFADFLGKQTEKIFNTRNAEMQKNLSTELNKAAVPTTPAAKSAPAPAAGNNMPMLLMGGGIGMAALGSSIAFIAKSLQNVSFTTILAVLAGIVVIFGGPSVINALVKIFRRNLSRFLESCGCAVNRPMRMSRKMGSIFTFTPVRPKGEITLTDLIDEFKLQGETPKKCRKTVLVIFIIVLVGAGGYRTWQYFRNRKTADIQIQKVEKKSNEVKKTSDNIKQPADGQKKPEAETKQGDK